MLGSFTAQFCLRGGKGNIFSLILQFLGWKAPQYLRLFLKIKKGKSRLKTVFSPFITGKTGEL